MHGFALNVNTDLTFFNKIIPCGITDSDKEVTSIAKESGSYVQSVEVKTKLLNHFADLFQFTYSLNSPLKS
jgi:lipoyl(octanoyl) transferase